jgi:DNA-binding LacI/PurR family transcriptional regulator
MSGPTMEDLAKKLDLSVSTISRALRDDARILPETRARVKAAAARLGYRPKARRRTHEAAAGDTAGERSRRCICALICDQPVLDFYSAYLGELAEAGRSQGFITKHEVIGADADLCAAASAAASACDAILLLTWWRLEPAQARQLAQLPCPVVHFNRHVPGVQYAVTLDDTSAGAQAADYLLVLGHRRIAHLPGPQWSSSLRERTSTFRALLECAGCYRPEYFTQPVPSRDILLEWARTEVEALLSLQQPPTAIWAYTDVAASIAIVTAQARGLRVPEDISIMGFDCTAELHEIGITTFQWPFAALARQTLLMLRLLFEEQAAAPLRYCVAPLLVEGRTTGPAPV